MIARAATRGGAVARGVAPKPLGDRFWPKVDRSAGLWGCWPWTGAYSVKSGAKPPRPVFWVGRVQLPGEAHRKAPQLLIAAARMALSLTDGVPLHEREGLEACHRPVVCDNPACVNPAHLYWGTPEENRRDRYGSKKLCDTLGEL